MIRKFKRDIASLDVIFDYVSTFTESHKIDEAMAYTLMLVVEEIFTNLVKYDPEADNEIPINLSHDDKKISIEFINNGGHKFDITASRPADIDVPLRERKVGGLGIHLVRHMVDDIEYNYANGTSTIRIVKYLEDSSV